MVSTTTKQIIHIFIYIFALIGFIFTAVFVGMQFGIFNVRGSSSERDAFFQNATTTKTITVSDETDCAENGLKTCTWNATREWSVVSAGLLKDKEVISRVSKETGVPERVLVAVIIPEQLRFFTSEREVFKKYFEPLKILGSMSQFSLGVSGIKPETAKKIEEYASSSTSPFFPGIQYSNLIAYKNSPSDSERFNRLTDSKNHYYSYLYTAIYIKEIEAQWRSAGFDIASKPEIIATLFNLGFSKSNPNQNASVGGAPITIGGKTYPYGELSKEFYYSKELPNF